MMNTNLPNLNFNNKPEEEKMNKESIQKEISYNRDSEIIKFPKMEIYLVNSKLVCITNEKIIITPNSINGVIKPIGEKFTFGRSAGLQLLPGSLQSVGVKQNDYNFSDDNIALKQFEAYYSEESKKYYIVENKGGTGLFVKIKNKTIIDHDMIISFCASHMVLQVESESMIIYKN